MSSAYHQAAPLLLQQGRLVLGVQWQTPGWWGRALEGHLAAPPALPLLLLLLTVWSVHCCCQLSGHTGMALASRSALLLLVV